MVLLAFNASHLCRTSILGLCKVGFPFLHPRTVIFLMPVSDRPCLLTLTRRQASAWYLCLTLLEKCGSCVSRGHGEDRSQGEMQMLQNEVEKHLWAFGDGLQLGLVDGNGALMSGSGIGDMSQVGVG